MDALYAVNTADVDLVLQVLLTLIPFQLDSNLRNQTEKNAPAANYAVSMRANFGLPQRAYVLHTYKNFPIFGKCYSCDKSNYITNLRHMIEFFKFPDFLNILNLILYRDNLFLQFLLCDIGPVRIPADRRLLIRYVM